MKYTVIAPVGDSIDALFIGIKEFPTERVVLLTPRARLQDAQRAKKDLEKFKIVCEIVELKGDLWENMFQKIAAIKEQEKNRQVIINVATGDKMSSCAATSAAFVNGIKAFGVDNGQVMLLPVLKFSYYKILTGRKLKILEVLFKGKNYCASLNDLSKLAGMSLPLISYHINGNFKSEGLREFGLVDTMEEQGKVKANLTAMGKLLIQGYIK